MSSEAQRLGKDVPAAQRVTPRICCEIPKSAFTKSADSHRMKLKTASQHIPGVGINNVNSGVRISGTGKRGTYTQH